MAEVTATRSYREQAVLLGPRQALLAVATLPAAKVDPAQSAVVILNTGIVHRVGHHRMWVTLARRLARRERIVVRFDMSGIGDSAPSRSSEPAVVTALDDIRTVLDWLQTRHGVSSVVLVGLCSGADHAVLHAHDDPRIAGLVLMDPSMPPTARYYVHYLWQRLGNARNWLGVISGRSGVVRLAARHLQTKARPVTDLKDITLGNLPFSPYLRQCYQRIASRGAKLLVVFTSDSVRQSYRLQFKDAFPEVASGTALRTEFFADSDHLFSSPALRERLYELISDWLNPG